MKLFQIALVVEYNNLLILVPKYSLNIYLN